MKSVKNLLNNKSVALATLCMMLAGSLSAHKDEETVRTETTKRGANGSVKTVKKVTKSSDKHTAGDENKTRSYAEKKRQAAMAKGKEKKSTTTVEKKRSTGRKAGAKTKSAKYNKKSKTVVTDKDGQEEEVSRKEEENEETVKDNGKEKKYSGQHGMTRADKIRKNKNQQ